MENNNMIWKGDRVEFHPRCDACGRFISHGDLQQGYAVHRLIYPDSALTKEEWETLCPKHK